MVRRCKALAYKKNISITTRAVPNLTILGDKGYLEKMLVNLVRNSIIYGNKNGQTIIDIDIKRLKGFITINVTDNGIGISAEDLPHIFEPFYRGSNVNDFKKNGAGLGLAIANEIAKIHHTKINVSSSQDRGTIFKIHFHSI